VKIFSIMYLVQPLSVEDLELATKGNELRLISVKLPASQIPAHCLSLHSLALADIRKQTFCELSGRWIEREQKINSSTC
jgi:hypothetical protein